MHILYIFVNHKLCFPSPALYLSWPLLLYICFLIVLFFFIATLKGIICSIFFIAAAHGKTENLLVCESITTINILSHLKYANFGHQIKLVSASRSPKATQHLFGWHRRPLILSYFISLRALVQNERSELQIPNLTRASDLPSSSSKKKLWVLLFSYIRFPAKKKEVNFKHYWLSHVHSWPNSLV